MGIFLLILRAVVQYRSILFPAIVGFIGAVATAMGRKIDIGRVQALVDATSVLATAGAAVIGYVLDANNAKVKQALTTQADAINHNADLQDPRTDTNPLQVPPAYVPSPPAVPPPPPTQVKP